MRRAPALDLLDLGVEAVAEPWEFVFVVVCCSVRAVDVGDAFVLEAAVGDLEGNGAVLARSVSVRKLTKVERKSSFVLKLYEVKI